MNVLIIAANRSRHPAPVLPYGACMAAEAAAAAGHRVELLDLMFQADPLGAVAAALWRFPAEVIGLSFRNLDNNDMQAPTEYVTELANLARTVQRLSPAPLVLGGPAVGIMPEALLRCTGASFAILGDGEAAFPALLGALDHSGGFSQVPRLAWLEDGLYRQSAPSRAPLRHCPVTPEFPRWLELKTYRDNLAAAPLQAKRGCPFSCIYCTYGISEGQDYRLLPPEEAAAAVHRLAAWGCRDIEFVDNVFNAPYEHALAICGHLARRSPAARLQTLELNPAFLDEKLLKTMARAGFVGIGVTAESAADAALVGLKKAFGAGEVERAAAAVRQSPLPCVWIFLLGGPGETAATVRASLDFARRTLRPGDVAYFNVGLRIYPGTELEDIARQEEVWAGAPEELLAPAFYFNPNLDYGWTLDQVRRAAADHLGILHSATLSHPWLPAVNRIFGRLPLRRPLWRHTRAIRRVVRALGRDI